jgi:hypothetical protein
VVVLALILFAILKRKPWALPVALSWYGLLIVQAIAHFALSYFYRSSLPDLYEKLFPAQGAFQNELSVMMTVFLTFVVSVLIYGGICWYLSSKRSYFIIEQDSDAAPIDLKQVMTASPLLVKRAIAAFLDYVLYTAIVFILIYFGYIGFFGVIGLWVLYFPGMEGMAGYTVFKGLFDLTLVKERRQDARFFVALKRHMLDPIDFASLGTVAVLMATLRDDHKRLGDLWAHSRIELEK